MFASRSHRSFALACLLWIGALAVASPVAAQNELNADAASHFRKGLDLFQRASYAEARDEFRASLDAQRHSQIAFYLGLTYARLGDPERAARYMNRALKWEPPLAAHDRGQAEVVMHWTEDANPGDVWTPSRGLPDAARKGDDPADEDRRAEPTWLPIPKAGAEVDRAERARVLNPYPEAFPEPPSDPKADLTGEWTSDDGSHYFLRQVGERVYWYGESPDGGASFANVFNGKRAGDKITGEWIDVPKGGAMNVGWLEFVVLDDGTLKKLASSIPYGASTWKR
jgi:tetratricopeptide (TPR) repeat protein